MAQRPTILFLAQGPDSLHVMAHALAAERSKGSIAIVSASMRPDRLHPACRDSLAEIDIDASAIPLLTPEDIELFLVHLVITIGDVDPNCRPRLPGMPPSIHWTVDQPTQHGNADDRLAAFRTAREQLESHIERLIQSQMLHALYTTRGKYEMILDNQVNGVMAHTTNRRIFTFNKAAEAITGYRREDVLGKDCHDVFPGRFCGGDCSFCGDITDTRQQSTKPRSIAFTRPDGEARALEMSTMPLCDENNDHVGALVSFKDNTELVSIKRRLRHHHSLGGLIGKDPKMLEIFELIREVAATDATVLITGESGTGKELAAEAIHRHSARADKPFVAVNCGALPDGILETELFGHIEGAFTGAIRDKKGRFELAHRGSILLDEIGELPTSMQVKLLRVLATGVIEPVGVERGRPVDVRIIAATNQNLDKLMKQGLFRQDLYYRLAVIPIEMPPLRDRRLDIPMLVEHFAELIASESGRQQLEPTTDAIDALVRYSWPGNVRELRNALEYAYVKAKGTELLSEHLPIEIRKDLTQTAAARGPAPRIGREQVIDALAKAKGNRKQAAKILGVGRATLYRYLNNYNLD